MVFGAISYQKAHKLEFLSQKVDCFVSDKRPKNRFVTSPNTYSE
jgi:hypothetical protein